MLDPISQGFLLRLARAVGELIAHFCLSVISLLTIAGTAFILRYLHLDSKAIPLLGLSLGDWTFLSEVASATLINLVGMIRAVIAYWE